MGTVKAIQLQAMSEGETRLFSVDCSGKLDNGELLSSASAVEVGGSSLTIANVAVNTAELRILKKTVAIGKAFQLLVSGVVDGTVHEIKATLTTDSSPAQTILVVLRIEGLADTD